jgi:hypothetical protein
VIFPYSSIISADPGTGDFLLFRRPEIPVTISGPIGSATYVGLVDTGSDNTIFPRSVAELLGISVQTSSGPAASVFGGQRVQLLTGEAILKLESDGQTLIWKTAVCFFDFATPEEETVILGHSAFLDYFTATSDGKSGVLTLIPNDELPSAS